MCLPDESNSELPDAFPRRWRFTSLEDSSRRVQIKSTTFQEPFISSICLHIFFSLPNVWDSSLTAEMHDASETDGWEGGGDRGTVVAEMWCNSWYLNKEFRQPQVVALVLENLTLIRKSFDFSLGHEPKKRRLVANFYNNSEIALAVN